MSGFPVRCERQDLPGGAKPDANFVITAEDWNRLVTGIEYTFPIELDATKSNEPFPWKVSVMYLPYPKTHPKFEEPVEYVPPKGYEGNVPPLGGERPKFSKGVYVASIHPGILFCADTASVGPSFWTEAWLLSDMAINRIKDEIKNGIFDSGKVDPDQKNSPSTKYKTFIWENSYLELKWQSYRPETTFSAGGNMRTTKKPIPAIFEGLGCVSKEVVEGKERELYSSDIIIQIRRPSTRLDFEFRPGMIFAGESVLGIVDTLVIPPDSGQAQIQSIAEWKPKITNNGGGIFGLLMDLYEDDGNDEWVIARVYLASPPAEWNVIGLFDQNNGAPLTPDPFIKQYWKSNVCYGWASPRQSIEGYQEGGFLGILGILGSFAGGIGYLVGAAMLSQMNFVNEIIMSILKAKKMEGTVWSV